ncbi:MAG: TIGR04282 family arsenosugar biosynthesis glycosyltransferase [Cyclobacteriaceae bacterium]|nr:TIGR04282 family arsenosugar biosynthesis glycosyltransferase [Cyclobacteriaceae bacterium]
MKKLVIIFYRNPVLGKVKTRLAKTIGDEKALAVYLYMAAHTRSITENLTPDKIVYYSDFVDREDAWNNSIYRKSLQQGKDLGEKMFRAFQAGFEKGYESICIIGTDCLELNTSSIESAFQALSKYDCVIGPARDGGYYLLGCTNLHPEFFTQKLWSTSSVANDTIHDFQQLRLSWLSLPVLRDVDEAKDLPPDFTI